MNLKILFVINSLGAGGAEQSLAGMLPRLRDIGLVPVVVCLAQKREGFQKDVERQGIDVRLLPGGNVFSRVRALRRVIAEERPDLIHTTLFAADQIGRLAAIRTGVPVLSSLVNDSYAPIRIQQDPNLTWWKMQIVRWVDAWTARHLTTHFHAITGAVKAAAVRDLKLRPERITVIERGRDAGRMGQPSPARRQKVRAALELIDEHEVLINVGRQEYQKGQCYLLEAVEEAARHRPNLRLLIAGREGNATPELRERMHRSTLLQEHVQFLGHRDDVPDLLAAADIFVFPSLFEGLGGSVIEAMALGLPVVASDLPALREVVDERRNALLVKPASPEAVAQAITTLLENPERMQAWSLHSRSVFENRFTLQQSIERMVDLYNQMAGAERHGEKELLLPRVWIHV